MRREYLEELAEMKSKMEKAEIFANKVPVFYDIILENKFSGEERQLNFGKNYKEMYFAWGINRIFFCNKTGGTITNYPRGLEYKKHLFSIYINTVNLFGEHNSFDLHRALNLEKVFFADDMNSTFYVTDEHIHEFLEAVNSWYCSAKEKLAVFKLQKKENELKRSLLETQERLSTMKGE